MLWKRSQGLPLVFFRRSAYISADGYALVYGNSKVTPTLILALARTLTGSNPDPDHDPNRTTPQGRIYRPLALVNLVIE